MSCLNASDYEPSSSPLKRGDVVLYRGELLYFQPNGNSCYLYERPEDIGCLKLKTNSPARTSVQKMERRRGGGRNKMKPHSNGMKSALEDLHELHSSPENSPYSYNSYYMQSVYTSTHSPIYSPMHTPPTSPYPSAHSPMYSPIHTPPASPFASMHSPAQSTSYSHSFSPKEEPKPTPTIPKPTPTPTYSPVPKPSPITTSTTPRPSTAYSYTSVKKEDDDTSSSSSFYSSTATSSTSRSSTASSARSVADNIAREEQLRCEIFKLKVAFLKKYSPDVYRSERWEDTDWGTTLSGKWIKFTGKIDEYGRLIGFKEASSTAAKLQISDPFSSGTFRLASYSKLVLDCSTAENGKHRVGKTLSRWEFVKNKKIEREACLTDIKAHMVADILAKIFTDKTKSETNRSLRYCQAEMFKVKEEDGIKEQRTDFFWQYIMLEELLPNFKKYNNNAGAVSNMSNTAQCFSHFTWHHTNGNIMVVDIQGSEEERDGVKYYLLSDPAIHCLKTNDYDLANTGEKGMKDFFKTHYCNELCRYLKLKKHPSQPIGVNPREGETVIRGSPAATRVAPVSPLASPAPSLPNVTVENIRYLLFDTEEGFVPNKMYLKQAVRAQKHAACSICKGFIANQVRYVCIQCPTTDVLCSTCEATPTRHSKHITIKFVPGRICNEIKLTKIQSRASCDHCDKSIYGYRFKCIECEDYDLCRTCEPRQHLHHTFTKINLRE